MGVPEITRYHGLITAVGNCPVRVVSLPDWSLDYIEYPPGEMEDYRYALQHGRVKIARVTKQRIYFEER